MQRDALLPFGRDAQLLEALGFGLDRFGVGRFGHGAQVIADFVPDGASASGPATHSRRIEARSGSVERTFCSMTTERAPI